MWTWRISSKVSRWENIYYFIVFVCLNLQNVEYCLSMFQILALSLADLACWRVWCLLDASRMDLYNICIFLFYLYINNIFCVFVIKILPMILISDFNWINMPINLYYNLLNTSLESALYETYFTIANFELCDKSIQCIILK